jgi:hypothetical protein
LGGAAQLLSLGGIEHMKPILAMGDIAGSLLFDGMLMSACILLVAIGLLALSLWKRSLVAVEIACIFVLIAGFVGVMLMPFAWDSFAYPLTTDNYYNVSLTYWCRVVTVIWVLAVSAAVAYFVRVIRQWKSKKDAQNAA